MARVLVVDADADIRTSLIDLLSLDGYVVLEAPTPEQALAILSTCPDCIVVVFDSGAPSSSGEDRAEGIATIVSAVVGQDLQDLQDIGAPHQHAFICLTTSPAHLHSRLHARLRDALGGEFIPIIQKPFDVDTLLAVVSDAAVVVDARNEVRTRQP